MTANEWLRGDNVLMSHMELRSYPIESCIHIHDFVHYYISQNERDCYTDSLINQLMLNFSSKTFLSEPDQKIIKAKNWINAHVAVPIDVAQVAGHCHLSTSQLQRRFKQETGSSVACSTISSPGGYLLHFM